MADPRIEAFKRFALQQAALQAPNDAVSQMANPLPQIGGAPTAPIAPEVPQVTAPQTVQSQPGPIKSFLSNFVSGAGQGLLKRVGLETDAEKQQRMFSQGIAQQNAQALNALREQQATASQAQNQMLDAGAIGQALGIPGLSGQMLAKDLPKVLAPYVTGQARKDVATTITEGRKDVAQTNAENKLDVQDVKGTQQAAHDQLMAQVRRDVEAGKNRLAGARLALAQRVAQAKMDGTYEAPTADRLRRADLANNAQVNLDNVISTIQKDPNIFGQIAGHYSTVQQMMGSDNPDIKTIGIEIHNAALASNGAHGLRAQGAIEGTENVMLNHFRDNPDVAVQGMKAMQNSLDTFIEDAQHGKHFVPRGSAPAASGGGKKGDPLGIR